jgi:hypothetical protein
MVYDGAEVGQQVYHNQGGRMTRAERLAQTEARARAKLDADRHRLAQVQAQQRDAARQALHRRRMLVGKLAEDAGLFALDDALLAGLFARLSPLVEAPDPVAALEALLQAAGGPPGTSVDGLAQAAPGVAPAVPL